MHTQFEPDNAIPAHTCWPDDWQPGDLPSHYIECPCCGRLHGHSPDDADDDWRTPPCGGAPYRVAFGCDVPPLNQAQVAEHNARIDATDEWMQGMQAREAQRQAMDNDPDLHIDPESEFGKWCLAHPFVDDAADPPDIDAAIDAADATFKHTLKTLQETGMSITAQELDEKSNVDYTLLVKLAENAKPDPKAIPVLTPDQCESAVPRPYIIKGILGRGDFGLLNGPPGAGKSALAPHFAYAIAQGRKVFGKRVRKGPVLYLAAEDGDGMRVRVRALRDRYGDAPGFHLVPVPVDLMTVKNAKLMELQDIVKRLNPVLIVVDTLKRAFPGIKENSGDADGMGRVVTVARGLASLCSSAVLILHHMPHDADRSRGHSSLPADADVDMVVKAAEDGKTRIVKFTKNRNGSADQTLQFGIRVEALGVDEDGDPITAVTAEELGTGNAAERKDGHGLTDQQRRALGILQYLSPNGEKIKEETWLAACIDQKVSGAERERQQRYKLRGILGVLALKKLVEISAGLIWTTEKGTRNDPDDKPQAPIKSQEIDLNGLIGGNK